MDSAIKLGDEKKRWQLNLCPRPTELPHLFNWKTPVLRAMAEPMQRDLAFGPFVCLPLQKHPSVLKSRLSAWPPHWPSVGASPQRPASPPPFRVGRNNRGFDVKQILIPIRLWGLLPVSLNLLWLSCCPNGRTCLAYGVVWEVRDNFGMNVKVDL